jgi:hypothetical protein
MSGRLVILPKKSYCPWNPKNVARVEHDEAQHRLALQQEEQRHEAVRADQRQAALRRTTDDPDQQHVNLFANEERKEQMLRKQLHAQQHITNRVCDESKDRESSRSHNLQVFGKVSLVGESTTKSYKQLYSHRDQQKKSTLDPMAHYVDPDADVEEDQFNFSSKEVTADGETRRDRKRKSSRSNEHDRRNSSQHPRAGSSRRFANDNGSAKDTSSGKHRKKAKKERSSSIHGSTMESNKVRKEITHKNRERLRTERVDSSTTRNPTRGSRGEF